MSNIDKVGVSGLTDLRRLILKETSVYLNTISLRSCFVIR